MGKERAETPRGGRIAPPGDLFSPSRLEIKPGTGTNCLGRMTAETVGPGL
jgi:hypothetical protein